jgi:CheY-like chemotaxis protein
MVSDTGCGMSEETIANIFEPFYTTKGVGKGTGLGLATVYGIVTQNGGVVEVVSELGRGTTFSIYLPVSMEERAADGVESVEVGGRGEIVMIVEDDPQLLTMTASILERLGYRALCAETPHQAILLARQHAEEILLILTDVIMPGMNGRELLKEIQTFAPKIKGIYMSGYTADVIGRHGVLNDGVAFVQKPFTKKLLAEKVRAVLDTES